MPACLEHGYVSFFQAEPLFSSKPATPSLIYLMAGVNPAVTFHAHLEAAFHWGTQSLQQLRLRTERDARFLEKLLHVLHLIIFHQSDTYEQRWLEVVEFVLAEEDRLVY